MEKRYKPTFTGVADFGVWAQTHPVLLDRGYKWVPSYSLNDGLHVYPPMNALYFSRGMKIKII